MKLILLDRDGVLNEDREDSVKSPEELVLLPGVGESIKRLNEQNLKVVLVSNQSVVGKGIITENMLGSINRKLISNLDKKHAHIDKMIYCFDPPDNPSPRRKPQPGMIFEAMKLFNASPDHTIMVGDAITDMEAAYHAGCHRALVMTGKGKKTKDDKRLLEYKPINLFESLLEAVDAIIAARLKPKN